MSAPQAVSTGPRKPLWLHGANPFHGDPYDGPAMASKFGRMVEVERFVVAVNLIEGGVETLRVLGPYHYTQKAAEEEQARMASEHPTCAVVSTISKLDPDDPGQRYAAERYMGRLVGRHGDGVQ